MPINVDEIKVKEFYENVPDVWPNDDLWHLYSKRQIEEFLHRLRFEKKEVILNAGSGGNNYGLNYDMHHLDIAENKIQHFENHFVASVEKMPFPNDLFDTVICVGSVINYCDAMIGVSEISRVLKVHGRVILEFESSWGFEYYGKSAYKKPAEIITAKYYNQPHVQWVYSFDYISKVLKACGLCIEKVYRYHILSGIHYNRHQNENRAAKYAKYDRLIQWLPYLKKRSNNIILLCTKL